MKKILIISCAAIFAFGCDSKTETKESTATAAPAEKIDYAYLPADHEPDFWERGDQKNLAMVLKSLKAYEEGNIKECLSYFADSVTWSFNGFDAKISKDSLTAMITGDMKKIGSVKIHMGDYETVISKDKKWEYVTLWYKQIMTDKAGKIDSLATVDDVRIENGKITQLDEKTRQYPAKR